MVTLAQLWLPILLAAVLVFVASSLIHMVFKWHATDYMRLANEDEVRAAVRAANASPGEYLVPYCNDMKAMSTPEFRKKFEEGPVGYLVLRPNGPPDMTRSLVLWFVFTLVLSFVAAYLACRVYPANASAMQVARLVFTVSFLAYVGGSVIGGIWMGKPWRNVAKEVLDGLIYAALTAAVFAWLWPR